MIHLQKMVSNPYQKQYTNTYLTFKRMHKQHFLKQFLMILTLLLTMSTTLFSSVDCQKVFDVQNFVQRFYVQVLEREGEHKGLDEWTNTLTSGQKSGADVAYGFVFSEEYLAKHTKDSNYLQTLYKAFFNREPDEGGFSYWLTQIQNGMPREEVLHGFVYSKEFEVLSASYGIKAYDGASGQLGLSSFVQRFYTVILGREAEQEGLDVWIAKLSAQEATAAEIAYAFIFSDEYNEKSKDDTSFLKRLYLAFFNREADSAGLTVWKEALSQGTSREEVVEAFLHSQEFIHFSNRYGIRAYEGAPEPTTVELSDTQYQAPYADAGIDQSIAQGHYVVLSAKKSVAREGSLVCTLWSDKEKILSTSTQWNTNSLTLGTYKIHLLVVDSHGLCASDSVQVIVTDAIDGTVDTTPPVITLHGEATLTLAQNAVYTELGATALDVVDGNVSVNISGTVDTSTVGKYTVTYTARDSVGNEVIITRSVEVINSTSTLSSITLESDVTTVNVGEMVHLSVVGTYSDGSSKTVNKNITYTVTPTENVEVNGSVLTAKKDGNVIVQATVGGVNSNSISLNITWVVDGHVLPPEPDPAVNNATLLGVDVNDNGVRDDVERWIYREYKDKHPIHIDIGMQAGRGWQRVLEDPSKAKEIHNLVRASGSCQSYYMRFAKYFNESLLVKKRIITKYFIHTVIFNTENREQAFDQYDTLLSGDSYTLPKLKEKKDLCDFNTSKYEE